MKGRIKRASLGVLVVASLVGLAACSSSGSGSGGTTASAEAIPDSVNLHGEKVVSLFTSMNNDYYASWAQGAQRAVEAFGGTYVGLTNEGDPGTELSQFQQQVDAGAKIIFITAPDPSNVPAMAKIAQDNGVCFANTWEQPAWTSPFDSGDQYVSYLTPDSEDVAYTVATALFKKMGGTGNVVHLTGHPGSTPDMLRNAGFDRALAENPGITVLATQPGEWDRDASRQAMAGIITQYGVDKIQGIFGQNDDVGIGALNAMTEAGVTTDKLPPITGIDGNLSTMQLIQAGQMFGSYSGIPQYQAGFSFVQALDFCKGATVNPLNRMLNTGGIFVTADNVDSYINTYTGDNNPYNWILMSKVAHPTDWDPQGAVKTIDMEKMWSLLEPKPAGWTAPPAYAAEVPNRATVDAEWASHWKTVKG